MSERDTTSAADASRRTHLANERTYLAWWRTGVTAVAVALATARIVPTLGDVGTRWPYTVLGVGYALAGVACVAYGARRRRAVDRAVAEGGYAPLGDTMVRVLSGAGVALGVVTVLVLVFDA